MDSSVSPPPHKLCTRLVGWSLGRSVGHPPRIVLPAPPSANGECPGTTFALGRARGYRDGGSGGGGGGGGRRPTRNNFDSAGLVGLACPEEGLSQGPEYRGPLFTRPLRVTAFARPLGVKKVTPRRCTRERSGCFSLCSRRLAAMRERY